MEKNNITIKKATTKNLPEILQIENSLNQNMFSKSNLESDLNNNFFSYFIAYVDSFPVGFIGIKSLLDTIDLEYIAVLDKYQNLGIGTELFNFILEYANKNNIKKILLEVRKSNFKAIKFYEKLGFYKISERKNYYSNNNEDAYIYSLQIKE